MEEEEDDEDEVEDEEEDTSTKFTETSKDEPLRYEENIYRAGGGLNLQEEHLPPTINQHLPPTINPRGINIPPPQHITSI